MDPAIRFVLFAVSFIFAALATFAVPGHPRFVWLSAAFMFFVAVFLGDAYKAL